MSQFNREQLKTKHLKDFEEAPRKPRQTSLPLEPEVEEYEDEEEEASGFPKIRLAIPLIITAIACFLGYAWYTDKFAISSNKDIPVVKADNTPVREKPADPGGMKIINQDKKVYDAISGDSTAGNEAATILPGPEEPLGHEEIAKQDSPAQLIEDITEGEPEQAEKPAEPEKVKTEVVKEIKEDKKETKIADLAAIAPAAAPAEKKAEKSEKQTAKTPEKTQQPVTAADIIDVTAPKKTAEKSKKPVKINKGYRVQLGSFRSEGDASANWKSVKKKFPDVLGAVNQYIEKADLGAKGVYYRLQAVGFKNESLARKACQKLTEKKQGCFFVGK